MSKAKILLVSFLVITTIVVVVIGRDFKDIEDQKLKDAISATHISLRSELLDEVSFQAEQISESQMITNSVNNISALEQAIQQTEKIELNSKENVSSLATLQLTLYRELLANARSEQIIGQLHEVFDFEENFNSDVDLILNENQPINLNKILSNQETIFNLMKGISDLDFSHLVPTYFVCDQAAIEQISSAQSIADPKSLNCDIQIQQLLLNQANITESLHGATQLAEEYKLLNDTTNIKTVVTHQLSQLAELNRIILEQDPRSTDFSKRFEEAKQEFSEIKSENNTISIIMRKNQQKQSDFVQRWQLLEGQLF